MYERGFCELVSRRGPLMSIQTFPMHPVTPRSGGFRGWAALAATAVAAILGGCAVTPVDSYVVGTPVVPSSAHYYGYSAPAPYYYAPGYYSGPYYGGYRARPRHLHPSPPPPPPRFSGRGDHPGWRGDRGPGRDLSRPDRPRPPGAGVPARPRPPDANRPMRPPSGGQHRGPGGPSGRGGNGLKPGELDGG